MAKGMMDLLGGAKSAEKVSPEEKPESKGRLSAAKALVAAIKAGDAKAADAALKTHYELCMGDYDE